MTLPNLGDIAQFIVAMTVLFNCYQSWRNGRRAKRIEKDVKEVIKATNGLTEQLVKTTGEAEFAKGVKEGEKNGKH